MGGDLVVIEFEKPYTEIMNMMAKDGYYEKEFSAITAAVWRKDGQDGDYNYPSPHLSIVCTELEISKELLSNYCVFIHAGLQTISFPKLPC